MTNLETFIAFTLIFVPALIFWILIIAYVVNKIFESIERDKQACDELSGYDKIVEQIKQGVCEESLADVINTLGEKKEKRDEYLKRNSNYEVAKVKYVYDKLDEYLNSDKATLEFQYVFGSVDSHENKKARWEARLKDLRKGYEEDFDNL